MDSAMAIIGNQVEMNEYCAMAIWPSLEIKEK